MTPEQFALVRLSCAQAMGDTLALEQDFYRRLFVIAPDLRARFLGDLDTESVKLRNMLSHAFGALVDMPFLVGTLEPLAKRGLARDVPEHHLRAIAQSLLWAIERKIGAAFTPQVCNAWIALFAVVVTLLRAPMTGMQGVRAA